MDDSKQALEDLALLVRLCDRMADEGGASLYSADTLAQRNAVVRRLRQHIDAKHDDAAALLLAETALGGATCHHTEATTHHMGDGTPVEFCPECGRNITVGGKPHGVLGASSAGDKPVTERPTCTYPTCDCDVPRPLPQGNKAWHCPKQQDHAAKVWNSISVDDGRSKP